MSKIEKNKMEDDLRELLENVLTVFENLLTTKEEVKLIEDQLSDYDSLTSLVQLIKQLFQLLQLKIKEKLTSNYKSENPYLDSTTQESANNKDYEELEKVLQKYESEIRNHIRIEQQLKLFGETMQAKLEESEKIRSELLDSTKSLINNIKRDNQELYEKIKFLQDHNTDLLKKLKKIEAEKNIIENKLLGINFIPSRLQTSDKIDLKTRKTQNSFHNNISIAPLEFESSIEKNQNTNPSKLVNKSKPKHEALLCFLNQNKIPKDLNKLKMNIFGKNNNKPSKKIINENKNYSKQLNINFNTANNKSVSNNSSFLINKSFGVNKARSKSTHEKNRSICKKETEHKRNQSKAF